MANIRTCNKHNMIACVEKTAHNADFYQIIDYLTGCSINYSLLVDPDLIGPWLQQFWATTSLQVINEVPHIRATVAGKKVLISEKTIRADLLFDDADGVDCFPKQVLWDSLRDIGYEGHIANGKPFLMYPRFIQLFLNKQLEGVTRPQNFLPSVTLPSKVFTFMRKNSPKFSGRITPLTPPMLEVITALAAEEAHSESTHSRAESSPRDAQGTPTQSAAQASILQGTAEAQGAADIPQSPNDYTPTDESQTSGGDEGLLDLYALNREVRRLKKQNISQAKQIHKLKAKLKKLSKGVKPLVKHHILWVKIKLGRNKDEGNLSEEHHDQDDHNHTAFVYEDFDATDAVVAVTPDLERKSDETEAIQVLPTQKKAPEEQFKDDEFLADIPLNIKKAKGNWVEKPKKKKLTLQQIRALETTHDEEVARKVQAEWDTEEERERLEDLKKPKPKTISEETYILFT
ncbi:hypothetical protein Tco_0016302 [Tanacetum coccineum]